MRCLTFPSNYLVYINLFGIFAKYKLIKAENYDGLRRNVRFQN